jgi:hypothetical protein
LSRRPSGRDGAPDSTAATGSRAIILLVAALVLGVFILNKTQHGGTAPTAVSSTPKTTTTKAGKGKGGTTTTPPSTRAVRPPAAIKVLAANGSGVAGLGGKTGDRLTAAGYNSLAPTNATSDVSTSVVAYTAGFDLESLFVAQALGLPPTSVKPLDSTIPVDDAKGADIVVVVGPDLDVTSTPTTAPTTPTTVFAVTTTR